LIMIWMSKEHVLPSGLDLWCMWWIDCSCSSDLWGFLLILANINCQNRIYVLVYIPGIFFSAEISEISPKTVNLGTLRETVLPDKKNRLHLNLYFRKSR
jgi:hypothetical protein